MGEIDDLRKEVALLRRVVETLIEVPAVYNSPSFARVIREMGYEIYSDPKSGSQLRKLAPQPGPGSQPASQQ
jgi:hypothetical protein